MSSTFVAPGATDPEKKFGTRAQTIVCVRHFMHAIHLQDCHLLLVTANTTTPSHTEGFNVVNVGFAS
jgi:hypothetical protein